MSMLAGLTPQIAAERRKRGVGLAAGGQRIRVLSSFNADLLPPFLAEAFDRAGAPVDVSVAPHFGDHKHRGAVAKFGRGLDRLPELPYQAIRALDRLKV